MQVGRQPPAGLAAEEDGDAPHILLLPEIVFDETRFLAKVEATLTKYGHCVIAVSEGVKGLDGAFLAAGSRMPSVMRSWEGLRQSLLTSSALS